MLNIPLALRIEKNKLVATAPWILLLDVTMGSEHLRLAKNTEDVLFNGETYTAFAFDLSESKVSNDGKVSSVNLSVYNNAQILNSILEQYNGFVSCPVTMYVVHTDNLESDYSDLTLNYIVTASHVDETMAVFTLGTENPLRRRFPLYAVLPNSCGWTFKGAECGYSGAASTCNRTLDECRSLNNSSRFGGRPGVTGAPKFRR